MKEEIAGDVLDIAPIEEIIKKIRKYDVPSIQLLRLTMALKDIRRTISGFQIFSEECKLF